MNSTKGKQSLENWANFESRSKIGVDFEQCCCCNHTGIKSDVKSECDAMLRIVGGEDAPAVVFKIQPFVGSISYHGLCHASAEYLLLVFVVDRHKQEFSEGLWGEARSSLHHGVPATILYYSLQGGPKKMSHSNF